MNLIHIAKQILFLIAMFVFLGIVSIRLQRKDKPLVSMFTYQMYVLCSIWAIINAVVIASYHILLFGQLLPILYFIISIGIFTITLRRMMAAGLL